MLIDRPNDIYCKRASGKYEKIGGMLIQSNIIGNSNTSDVIIGMILYTIGSNVIGIGLNVYNSDPMTSLNDVFQDHNYKDTPNIEDILAEFFNAFESDIEEFKKNGFSVFYKRYYSAWIHRYPH